MKVTIDKKYKPLIDKWLTALRSGEYEQGYGQLYEEEKYCCLGVLCELSGVDKKVMEDNQLGLPSELLEEDLGNQDISFIWDNDEFFEEVLPVINDYDTDAIPHKKWKTELTKYHGNPNFETIANIIEKYVDYE